MSLADNKQFSASPLPSKGASLQQRRLTRQRRLRDLSDQHAGFHSSLPASPASSSSSAVPHPLPLPHAPPPASASRMMGDHGAARNLRTSSNLSRPTFDPVIANAKYDLRVNIPGPRVLAGHISCKDPTELYHDNIDSENISNLKLHFAAKSAPTSIFSSPVTSPRRASPVTSPRRVDFFYPSIHFPQDFNDLLRMSPTTTVHSPDRSPLRTPGSHSPCLNPTIQEGCQQHKSSSRMWPENNHVDAHPLPRPPPAQSSPQQQTSFLRHTTEISPSMKGQWQKGKLIGRGSFGSVYHATNLETGASCAMKEVDLIPDDPKLAECIKQLEQEIRILRQLQHPNIVQYYGSEIVGDHLCIYMEYVHPGSIHKFINEHCGAMTESVVRNFTRHILSGLAYLHSMKTIHRDIKGANLLVDASGIVKLADFGVAKILSEKSFELSLKGSPYWMAPELMKAAIKKERNPDLAMAIDIWSLGCTIIEMVTGKPPWCDFNGPQAMFKVLHKSPPIPETLSSEGQDFLQRCFRRNPADRPSAAMLLTHAFVQNLHDQDVSVHSQGYPRGDPGAGDNSPSPGYSFKKGRDAVSTSIGARIFKKIHNLIGDTSKKYDKTQESNGMTSSPDSSCSMTEVSGRQSPTTSSTLNYISVANSSNIPLTVMRIIKHL